MPIQKAPAFGALVSADLPAGTFLLTASGVVQGTDTAVVCRFNGGGVAFPIQQIFPGGNQFAVHLTGRVDLTAPGPVSVECAHQDFAKASVQGVGFQLLAQGVTVQDNG